MKRLPDPTFDQRLADWLEDDPSTAPREVLATVLAAFPSIDQRRRSRAPWRFPIMNRYLIPIAAAVIVAVGALYLISRPSSQIGPPASPSLTAASATIEGTWTVTFTHQEMLDAGITDQSEDNLSNYGTFRLTFQSGWWANRQLAPIESGGGTATYTVDATTIHLFSPEDNVTFDLPYTVTSTTLTLGPGGPVTFRVKPWTRIATEVITATPEPAVTPNPTVTSADVGRALGAGTYEVQGFAKLFTITLPDRWTASELTPTSVVLASSTDGSTNLAMYVLNKVYGDPCHPAGAATAVQPGADKLLTALAGVTGFAVGSAQPVNIGGAAGTTFTFGNAINPGPAGCAANPMPFGRHANGGTDVDVQMFGGETDQFWALDDGATTMLIAVTDSRVDAVQPLIDSISFKN